MGIQGDPQIADEREKRLEELEATIESLRDDAEIMHVLLGVASALAEVRTVAETLEKAVRIIPEIFGADRCFAATWDRNSGLFQLHATHGYSESALSLMEELAAVPEGLPLMSAALTQRAPLLVSDARLDERISDADVERRKLGAYIGIPLLRWGEDFGGLGVEFSSPRAFSAKEMALARGVARQIAVALANARRFNLLQTLRSFGLKVGGSQLRLSSVTQEIARGAALLVSADSSMVCFLDSEHRSLIAAGAYEVDPGLADALARIDLGRPPWNEVLAGRNVMVARLPELVEMPDAPPAAFAVVIPGTEQPVLGVILLLFSRTFELGIEEADALDVLATQGSTAIENAQRFERQRRVARSLQEALLSTEATELSTCEFGAVYEAASSEADIGGDFYDVFELPSGHVALVVGDVSGKGAEAAALTAMAKYMLRAFATRDSTPSSVLYHLNNALVQGFGEDRFTTCVYALYDPEARRCKVSLGGHPPPLIYRGGTGQVEEIEAQGTIIGVFEDELFGSEEFTLEDEDVLIVYTDGLIEARDVAGELYGRDRVRESLMAEAALGDSEKIARSMYEGAKKFGTIGDDTVVFAFNCRHK